MTGAKNADKGNCTALSIVAGKPLLQHWMEAALTVPRLQPLLEKVRAYQAGLMKRRKLLVS